MDDGEHETWTEVMLGGCVVPSTVTLADPDLVESSVDVAVMVAVVVAVIDAEGVNTPVALIVPFVAVHVTEGL